MGCYGLGVSRILAAVLEHSAVEQAERIVWPRAIAPYSTCIVPMSSKKVRQTGSLLQNTEMLLFALYIRRHLDTVQLCKTVYKYYSKCTFGVKLCN